MTLAEESSALTEALSAWKAQDLDLLLTYFTEDVLYLINVDGIQVPYAMSAVGKDDLRGRLQLVIDTFVLERYTVEKIVHDPDHSRAYAHGVYRHRATGELLDISFRFCAWITGGLMVRVHELHDAAYLAAFEKFVFHLAAAAPQDG